MIRCARWCVSTKPRSRQKAKPIDAFDAAGAGDPDGASRGRRGPSSLWAAEETSPCYRRSGDSAAPSPPSNRHIAKPRRRYAAGIPQYSRGLTRLWPPILSSSPSMRLRSFERSNMPCASAKGPLSNRPFVADPGRGRRAAVRREQRTGSRPRPRRRAEDADDRR